MTRRDELGWGRVLLASGLIGLFFNVACCVTLEDVVQAVEILQEVQRP